MTPNYAGGPPPIEHDLPTLLTLLALLGLLAIFLSVIP